MLKSKYASITRSLLEQHDLSEWADVETAPIKPWQINGHELLWYNVDLDILNKPIDMLLVDGPPGVDDPMARYPAVPVLQRHLSEECTIVLDDGDRSGELETAHRWTDELSGELKYGGGAKGTWIIRRKNFLNHDEVQRAARSSFYHHSLLQR
ncbi:hypothetical protein GGP62_003372 [Salinibacter ruber]|uniref:hypothetical protein n=1 Tax=Salinibacter ruber TaxID=146919 RepID=UPI00216954B3|nr:hypothetical protein [Salinibacter ruber]MCS3708350.1 hypothetical protein [Salinibacter ruber]